MNDFDCDLSSGVCPVCGRGGIPGTLRNCTFQDVKGFGLGDFVASGLAAVGITKERVEAIVGGPCGCQQRQEALNELGRKIGIG
jgi:hypothetical protein